MCVGQEWATFYCYSMLHHWPRLFVGVQILRRHFELAENQCKRKERESSVHLSSVKPAAAAVCVSASFYTVSIFLLRSPVVLFNVKLRSIMLPVPATVILVSFAFVSNDLI